ncbi:MAG: Gfo/Idh/MocA family oxidoreductase [Isosphaeraceae bacterium]
MGFPTIVRSTALGRGLVPAPSERIRVGLIGCGNHGLGWNLPRIFECTEVEVVAICDVDAKHLAEGRRRVDDHFAPRVGKSYRGVETERDFRRLVRRKDLDAIVNCTPDHWHVLPSIMAARCGKDVICEKPLTLFVAEGQALCKAVRTNGRVFQTASENRSIDVHRRIVALVRAGAIGRLRHIEVGLPSGNTEVRLAARDRSTFSQSQPQPVPADLDYDTWLGQAPDMPYIPARVHGSFRWNLAFSGGVLTDWGAHMIDLAQWGHNSETTGPVSVEGRGDFPPRDAVFNTAATFRLRYRYADGVTLGVSTTDASIRFEGSDGWVECPGWRAPLRASHREILETRVDEKELGLDPPSLVVDARDGMRGGEHRNFYDCVKSRRPTYAPAEVGHRSITIAHIGNIAMQLGRPLTWDPVSETFPGDAEANARLTRRQREPWTIENIDRWL